MIPGFYLTPEEVAQLQALGFHRVADDPAPGVKPLPGLLTPRILAAFRKRQAADHHHGETMNDHGHMNSFQKKMQEIELARIKRDAEAAAASVLREALNRGITADALFIEGGMVRTDRVVLRSGDLRITIESGV